MSCYWHQMSDELYNGLGDAILDFKSTEETSLLIQLLRELKQMHLEGRFPKLAEIEAAFNDPFWADRDRILTADEIDACGSLFESILESE
ncbi:MAG: hypothetical protein AAFQ34_13760 [Pseudomonadota bacterium]